MISFVCHLEYDGVESKELDGLYMSPILCQWLLRSEICCNICVEKKGNGV